MASRTLYGYLDLSAALCWVVLATGAVALPLGGIPRLVLVVPVAIFVPGYALVSIAYPTAGGPPDESTLGRSEIGLRETFARGDHAVGSVERVALALLWSIVLVPSVALAVHLSPYPIETGPILLGVFGTTFALLVVAFASRARHPEDERYAPSLPARSNRSSGGLDPQPARSGASILLAVSLLVLSSSVAYALVAPPQGEGFTELYVQSGDVTNETTALYPSTLVQGETQPFEFGVTNREGDPVTYGYAVAFQRIDGTGDDAEVLAETEVERGTFELGDGATRNVTAQVTPETTGEDYRVVVLLYRGPPPSNPDADGAYRSLRLPVDVLAEESADDAAARDARVAG